MLGACARWLTLSAANYNKLADTFVAIRAAGLDRAHTL